MEKKGSDHFRDILNPYGEKSNYGKIGRRRRLSKLNVFFFSIILSVTIYIYILVYIYISDYSETVKSLLVVYSDGVRQIQYIMSHCCFHLKGLTVAAHFRTGPGRFMAAAHPVCQYSLHHQAGNQLQGVTRPTIMWVKQYPLVI